MSDSTQNSYSQPLSQQQEGPSHYYLLLLLDLYLLRSDLLDK
jgi:hypothetical protein